MTRGRAWLLGGVALLCAAPVAAAFAVRQSLNPELVKARVVAEVARATGRAVRVGTLHVSILPELAIDADDVALANPPGLSRAAMLTADSVQARVALLPLLARRVVVRSLVLRGVDLRLERVAGQDPNWVFAAGRGSAPLAGAARTRGVAGPRLKSLTLLGVDASGVLGWQGLAGDPMSGSAIPVTRLRMQAVNAGSTITLSALAVVNGVQAALDGRLGGQTHLWNAADRSEWPVELAVVLAGPRGGRMGVNGSCTDPRALAGCDVVVTAGGADPGALFAAWPRLAVPRLRDVALEMRVVDRDGRIDVPRLTLAAGASDLSGSVPGLALQRLSVTAPNIDGTNGNQANEVSATGSYAGQALSVQARLGPVGRLFGRGRVAARSPIALNATVAAAGATLAVRGRVVPVGDWGGTDATLTLNAPDPVLLRPLLRAALPGLPPVPALHGLSLSGAVRSHGGMLDVSGVKLAGDGVALAADAVLRLGGRASVSGSVDADLLDVDALRAAFAAPERAVPGGAQAVRTAPAAGSPMPGWVEALRGLDADAQISVARLLLHRVAWQNVNLHARLLRGRLDADPVLFALGPAHGTGSVSVDAARAVPAMAVSLQAQGLDAARVAQTAGWEGAASGTLDLELALAGSGADAAAVVASLNGSAGIALSDGSVANAVLGDVLAAVSPARALAMAGLGRGGQTQLSCAAGRFDVAGGVAQLHDVLLVSPHVRLAAAGTVDLRAGTLDLRLRPWIGFGGTWMQAGGLVVPGTARGPWRDPVLAPEPAGAAGALPEGAVDRGDCGPSLAAARAGLGGTVVAGVPAAPETEAGQAAAPSRRERAIELLRRLFR